MTKSAMSTPLMSTPLMSTPLMSTPLMSTPLMSTPLMSTPLIPRLGFIARSLLTALMCSLAVPALAETIDVYDNHGGSVFQYNARWVGLAARGVDVRIVGPCQSACTILLGHIPRNKI